MKSKETRKIEVQARMQKHNSLTTLQKIEKAKSRRGNSKRELARLNAKLESEAQISAEKNQKPAKKK